MIKIDDKTGWRLLIEAEMQRLQALLVDMERLLAGDYPSHAELSNAVLIVNPALADYTLPSFIGMVVNHPTHGVGVAQTSPIEFASAAGWFRSSNRLYRLERHQ